MNAKRLGWAAAGLCLVATAACGGDDDAAPASTSTAGPTTVAAADEGPPSGPGTTEPVATEPATAPTSTPSTNAPTSPPSTSEPEPAPTTAPVAPVLLEAEFESLDPGRYRVETLGAPFEIDIPDGWRVQYNSFGYVVLTDEDSFAPGEFDIQMIRPSNLADPDRPGAPAAEPDGGWPLDDITGWVDALIPGVASGEPVATTFGGRDADRFDVAIGDEVECGDECGFVTNRLVHDVWFSPDAGYRVWWVDGGDESPIAVVVGDGGDPDFFVRAEALLDAIVFESVGPNPVPGEGDLCELGYPCQAPAGTVMLPTGPGVTFELAEPHRIFQSDDFKSRVLLDEPAEVDIFFPDRSADGDAVVTADDVVAALEDDPENTVTVVGTRAVGELEATEVEFSSGAGSGPDGPVPALMSSTVPDTGWIAPPDASMWIIETSTGLAVVTAEWFDPTGREPAITLAGAILDSIEFGAGSGATG